MGVLITGGTGLIGRALSAKLVRANYEVIVLSRHPDKVHGLPAGVKAIGWDGKTAQGWGELADGAFAIVNLAGESLAGDSWFSIRWTPERKERILSSRLNAGRAVVEALKAAKVKPQVVVQASGVGFYGPRGSEPVFEEAEPGADFLARLAVAWEAGTQAVETQGVRRVVVRLGVVLAKEGGALQRQALPFKLFVGGPLGSGKQGYAWIHLEDAVEAIRFLIENDQAQGVYNLTVPQLVTNAGFGRALGRALHRPFYFPVPAFALRLAFGEASTILLDGQLPDSKRLRDLGFAFRFPDVEGALKDIFS